MKTTKEKDFFVIGVIVGALLFVVLQYVLVHFVFSNKNSQNTSKTYKDVGGNIDIEYYLEVSEDSIWVEGVTSKKVYSGKYSDLDSLIIKDNL
jgi:heme/copper-type cytochrome/quinol oxidase subunit 2